VFKIVFDTNVLVSSIFWENGAPHEVVAKAQEQKVQNHTSLELLRELEDILLHKFKQPEDIVKRQLDLVRAFSFIIEPMTRIFAVKDDPDDNMVLECAVSCNADYIISGDSHLLSLKEYKGIKVLSSREFLEII